jgi:DNA invertase Pin-like site-specific DNA recombinase
MGERAARWFRVSTDKQDEKNQHDDVNHHIGSRGYEVARTFTLHAVSAAKGAQEPELAELLADIEAGRYTVVVVAQSSRLDRRDSLDAQIAFAAMVRLAGGRVESVDEPEFGKGDLPGWITTFITMNGNAKFIRDLKANTRRGKDRIRANGALDGRTPWGFISEGPRYDRRLVPTDEAREYVPQIFAQVIGGRSLAQVARWLEREGVLPAGIASEDSERGKSGQWWPRSVGQIIRNPVYMGQKTDSHGHTTTTCEALVDAATWTRAGQALDARPKRGPVLAGNRCALSGAVKCWKCGGPLYRIRDGRGGTYYLRCAGTGAARKSCGAPMIRLDVAEALADEVLGGLVHPVYEYRVVTGNEAQIDARLAELDFERRQVALRGLSWEDEDRERARIRAAYELAASAERIPTRRIPADTGVTYGQRWHKLDTNGRADWLRSGEVAVYLVKGEADRAEGTRDGVSLVLVWPADDEAAA